MNHIIFINLNFVASAAISKQNTRNSKFAELIAFSSKWIINRQSVFKKTMIKFEINIKNFRQQYFQSRTKTFFSANNISSDRKFNSFALKFTWRFLKTIYNKFTRDRSQFQFILTF